MQGNVDILLLGILRGCPKVVQNTLLSLTNIKMSDKNILPPGVSQGPEGASFLSLF